MEDPPEDVRPASDEERPDFDDWDDPAVAVSGNRTRDDFLDVALQLREPTAISTIAERADRGEDAAREYMEFFGTIGLVTKHDGRPTRYEVNRRYLRWRRVERLRTEHTEAELIEHLSDADEKIRTYREQFDASDPDEVSIQQHADETERDVEEVWRDLTEWKSAERRRAMLEVALQQRDSIDSFDVGLTA